MEQNHLKKFAKITQFIEDGPWPGPVLERHLLTILHEQEHAAKYAQTLKNASASMNGPWFETMWTANLVGTNLLKLSGYDKDAFEANNLDKGVLMFFDLALFGEQMLVSGVTNTGEGLGEVDDKDIQAFIAGSPYNTDSFGPALSKVMGNQNMFKSLLLAVIERTNLRARPLLGVRYQIVVAMTPNLKELSFQIGHPNEVPLDQVFAKLAIVNGKVWVDGMIPERGQASQSSSAMQQVLSGNPWAIKDLMKALFIITNQDKAGEISKDVERCIAGLGAYQPHEGKMSVVFGTESNKLILNLNIVGDVTYKLMYGMHPIDGGGLAFSSLLSVLTPHGPLYPTQHGWKPGASQQRWDGPNRGQQRMMGNGWPASGYPYSASGPFDQPYGYPGQFAIPRWGMHGQMHGYTQGPASMNVTMQVRTYEEIEKIVEMLADTNPSVHRELLQLQLLMEDGKGTFEDPFQHAYFTFAVEPDPVGSKVSLTKFDHGTGRPISSYQFFIYR